MNEKNLLKINNSTFKLNDEESKLTLYVENNKIVSCYLVCDFIESNYENSIISPKIEIKNIILEKNNINELIGPLKTVNSVEEAYNSEDILYLYESEPFTKYKLEILEINNEKVLINLKGEAITNGYSKPYKVAPIELECVVNVKIINKENNLKSIKSKPKRIYSLLLLILSVILGIIVFVTQNNIVTILFGFSVILTLVIYDLEGKKRK